MNNYYVLLFFGLLIGSTCCTKRLVISAPSREAPPKDTLFAKAGAEQLETIAFGSCNKVTLPQTMWPIISENEPDLWIWLGDIIYSDTRDMGRLESNYNKQKTEPSYQTFIQSCPVIGIYDDHDYGENDGGKTYSKKKESKALLLKFLDVPPDNPAWQREGAYQSYSYGPQGKKVKVILLDTRYFRDELKKNASPGQRYFPNETGTILGNKQWRWLEKQLTNSDAQVHLIGSSIQVLSKDHRFEKWENFPSERTRLLRLIQKVKPKKAILISGDRHTSEVSKIALKKLPYSLYEITSSSLTHAYRRTEIEANQYRVGKMVEENNFSLLKFDWHQNGVGVKVEIRGAGNKIYETVNLFSK